MTTEIERKWVLTSAPSPHLLRSGDRLRQGYLACDADVEVPLRFSASSTTLTIKGGTGLRRTEVELSVSDRNPARRCGPSLLAAASRRYDTVSRSEVTAEVDIYEGALEGLCTAEVEFRSLDDAHAFIPPPWFGTEVTGEKGWTRASLAQHGMPR